MQPYGASTKFNKLGVRNYESSEDGIAATITTLLNGYYPDLLTRLRSDVNPPEIARTTTRTVDDKVDNDNKDIENNSDSSLLGLLGLGLTGIIGTEIFGSGTGQLIGNKGGGDDGDWGGSLSKLISILPAGSWKAGSQKRIKQTTASGHTSDHYDGRTDSYAGDFGLNSTFGGDKEKATQFAIAVAQNAGKDIDSWTPYIGKYLNIDSASSFTSMYSSGNIDFSLYSLLDLSLIIRLILFML